MRSRKNLVTSDARLSFPSVLALRRAHLVPVFSFGENELFNQVENPPGSLLRRLQERLQRAMGLALPLFHARGVFQYSFGLLPFRNPVHTVGRLIDDRHESAYVHTAMKLLRKSTPPPPPTAGTVG